MCLSPKTRPTTTELWHQELVVGLHWAFGNVMTSHLQVRAGRAHYTLPQLHFAPRSQTRTHPDRNSHRVALRLTNSNSTFCTPYTQDPDTLFPWRGLLVGRILHLDVQRILNRKDRPYAHRNTIHEAQ